MSRRPLGYAVIVDPAAPRAVEMDTFTCCHCSAVQTLHRRDGTRKEEPGFCLMCMRQVCDRCDAHGRCTPFEKKLEASEARDRLMKAMVG